MAQVTNGRFTARMDEPFAVFIIGMRINNFFAFKKWVPTVRAMGPMLRELYKHPEKGFLGGEFFVYWRGPALVQYWRSFEDLERFARNPDDPHLPLGAASTRPSAPTARSVSGTRPTWSSRAPMRRSTPNRTKSISLPVTGGMAGASVLARFQRVAYG